jgi:dynein heavy chain
MYAFILQNAAYESCKPLGSWIYDLKLRVDFFALWADIIINNVEKLIKRTLTTHSATTPESEIEDAPSNIPRAFWLSGFFFPQGNVINFME